jgi:hypothetical protein
MTDFFRYDHLIMRYDPFPIGLARPLVDEDTYRQMVDAFPTLERFQALSKVGDKFTLSEKFHPEVFREYVKGHPLWREFHRWIKSREFVRGLFHALEERYIDLGFELETPRFTLFQKRIADALRGGSRINSLVLRSRFEFSMLPAQGGHVIPHTDGHNKVVTLVVSMLHENEWDPAWGGGTDVNRPKDPRRIFNRMNRQLGFDEVEVLDTFAFEPNQAVIFVKTFNSWHSVRPMTGPDPKIMRRTLTINIETPS